MKDGFRVSRMNLVLIAFVSIGLFFYAFSVTYMTMRRVQEAEETGRRLEDRLRTQELLYPVYTGLMRSLSEPEPAPELSLPVPLPLPGDVLRDLQGIFGPVARNTGLELKALLPDADAYDPREGLLSLSMVLAGRPQDFHAFLLELGAMASVDSFLSLDVSSLGTLREMRLRLQLRMEPGRGHRS